jgi:hypothetical protein
MAGTNPAASFRARWSGLERAWSPVNLGTVVRLGKHRRPRILPRWNCRCQQPHHEKREGPASGALAHSIRSKGNAWTPEVGL